MRVAARRAPRGFTLLEVVIAIGLGLLVATTLYHMMAMHFAQTEIGRGVAEDAQTLRALVQRLRDDVRNIAFEWTPPVDPATLAAPAEAAGASGGAAAGTGGTAAGGGATATATATAEPPVNDYPGGVAGTDSSLTLATRRATRDLDFSESGGPAQALRTVNYRVGAPQDGGPAGLVREEYDRTPDLASGAPLRSENLAPEVEALSLRYFDGTAWTTAWDNTQSKAPYAVEVTLQVRLKRITPSAPDGVRRVVAVIPVPGADLPAAASSSTGGS
jgi:prepilin-type N-terminal cleavage/methylation domain-containing protein